MARLNQQYRRQARLQAEAEVKPQINRARRGLHSEVSALRSEEDPLTEGLDAATAAIKNSNLSGRDKAEALKDFAGRQADIPASIVSQIASAREGAHGEISDLQSQESAQQASILSSLLAAATQHQQEVGDDRRQTQEGIGATIKQQELEKALGLGDYGQTPEEEASTHKTEVETAQLEKGGGLTPYQQAEKTESHQEDHETAAHYARSLVEEARAGKIPSVPSDPKEFTPQIWNELVTHVHESGKVPVAAAEKAVQAVRAHFTGGGGDPFGIVGNAAHAAAGAITHSGAAHPSASDPSSLLDLLTAATPRRGY